MSINKFKLIIPAIILTPFITFAEIPKTYQVIIGIPGINFYNGTVPPVEEPVIPEEPEDLTASSCKGLLLKDPSLTDGIHTIKYNDSDLSVYCDMSNGGWTLVGRGIQLYTTNWSNPDGISSNPAGTSTYRLSDAVINNIPKNVFKTVSIGVYSTTRYWSGSCSYNSISVASGTCLQSYSNEALTAGFRQGIAKTETGGLSDWILSENSVMAATQYYGSIAYHGWSAGNGITNQAGTGAAGGKSNMQIWVK